jgi:hypothetical protein
MNEVAAEVVSEPAQHKKRRRLLPLLLIFLILVAAALAAAWVFRDAWLPSSDSASTTDDSWYDSGMTIGSYEGETVDEIQAELDKTVAENEMNVSCAPIVTVDASTGVAEVRVENIAANHVDQRFTITLSDGTVLYSSGAVAPGNHVQSITLETVPASGTSDATITFQGYDSDTHTAKGGTVSVQVQLVVS